MLIKTFPKVVQALFDHCFKTVYLKTKFSCKFEDNRCASNRTRHDYNYQREAGCCRGCAMQGGYFSYEGMPLATALYIRANPTIWDNMTGFYRKDRGCILPTELRSITCLYYTCSCGVRGGKSRAALSNAMQACRGAMHMGKPAGIILLPEVREGGKVKIELDSDRRQQGEEIK